MIPQEADQTHIEYGFPVVVPACNTLSTRKDLWEWGRLSQQKQVRKHEGTCVKRAARVWSDETVWDWIYWVRGFANVLLD